MSDLVKAAIFLALGLIGAAFFWTHNAPYNVCMRAMVSGGEDAPSAAMACKASNQILS